VPWWAASSNALPMPHTLQADRPVIAERLIDMSGWEITVLAFVSAFGSLTFVTLVAHRVETIEAAYSRETRRSATRRNS